MYRKIQKCYIVFILLCLSVSTKLINANNFNNSDSVSNLEKYHGILNYVEQMGYDIYCYWDIKDQQHGVDWKKIIANAHSKISNTTTDAEFQSILREVASGVKDGHVNYINKDKKNLYYLPINLKKIDNSYYISNVDQKQLSIYNIDLQPGDKVLSFDGESIEQVVEQRAKYISASTTNAVYSYATSSLNSWPYYFGAPGNTVKLKIERSTKNQTLETELPWLIYTADEHEHLLAERSLSDVVQAKILPGNIGLLKLKAMYNEVGLDKHIAYISSQIDLLVNTNALIIDVRNNGGGYGEIGDSVVARLIEQKVTRYKKQIKNSIQLFFARPELLQEFSQTDPKLNEYSEWQDADIEPNTTDKKYSKPVYILVNERCFSACDTFVDSFSANKLGMVLGTQSGGGTGYPLWIDLPWNMGNFRFSVMRGYSNHDRYLEGTGTIPDIEVHPDVEGLSSNIDTELLKTYKYVINDLNSKSDINSTLKFKSLDTAKLAELFRSYNISSDIVPYEIEEQFWLKAQSVN